MVAAGSAPRVANGRGSTSLRQGSIGLSGHVAPHGSPFLAISMLRKPTPMSENRNRPPQTLVVSAPGPRGDGHGLALRRLHTHSRPRPSDTAGLQTPVQTSATTRSAHLPSRPPTRASGPNRISIAVRIAPAKVPSESATIASKAIKVAPDRRNSGDGNRSPQSERLFHSPRSPPLGQLRRGRIPLTPRPTRGPPRAPASGPCPPTSGRPRRP